MRFWLRISLTVLIATAVGLATFIALFLIVGRYATCPPDYPTCDLPMLGGFGLGVIVGSLVGISAGVWSFRRFGPIIEDSFRPPPNVR